MTHLQVRISNNEKWKNHYVCVDVESIDLIVPTILFTSDFSLYFDTMSFPVSADTVQTRGRPIKIGNSKYSLVYFQQVHRKD